MSLEQGNSSMCGLGESAPVQILWLLQLHVCVCLFRAMFYYEEEMQGQAAGRRQSNRVWWRAGGGRSSERDAHGAVGRSFDRRRLAEKKNLEIKI